MRSKKGQAIPQELRTPQAVAELEEYLADARKRKDLALVLRIRAILGYIDGKSVISLAESLDLGRATINKWLGWYRGAGVEGLFTLDRPGAPRKLSDAERAELGRIIEAGPMAAGYTSGVWTGPMIGDLIRQRFGASYHNHSVPKLLAKMGFSVQRPRKRLARADAAAQQEWVDERLPAIKKKPTSAEASSCSRTRSASGRTARCTGPGRQSARART